MRPSRERGESERSECEGRVTVGAGLMGVFGDSDRMGMAVVWLDERPLNIRQLPEIPLLPLG